MRYFIFYRENNKFEDILSDPVLKKLIDEKTRWLKHLMIGINDEDEKTASYITLRYGDEMTRPYNKDFAPVPGIDYIQKKDPATFMQKIRNKK